MSKKIFAALIVAVVATFAGYNIYKSQRAEVTMSDLAMANVEALADSRESSADCTFGNVNYDQYSNTLHCSGNGTLCYIKTVAG